MQAARVGLKVALVENNALFGGTATAGFVPVWHAMYSTKGKRIVRADPTANRKRICDLRLTSGDIAVHSDMLVWSRDETPEGAAVQLTMVMPFWILANIRTAIRFQSYMKLDNFGNQ